MNTLQLAALPVKILISSATKNAIVAPIIVILAWIALLVKHVLPLSCSIEPEPPVLAIALKEKLMSPELATTALTIV